MCAHSLRQFQWLLYPQCNPPACAIYTNTNRHTHSSVCLLYSSPVVSCMVVHMCCFFQFLTILRYDLHTYCLQSPSVWSTLFKISAHFCSQYRTKYGLLTVFKKHMAHVSWSQSMVLFKAIRHDLHSLSTSCYIQCRYGLCSLQKSM